MANILVTGGSGIVGSRLVPGLINLGHLVQNYDLQNGDDIFDRNKLFSCLDGKDVVIHLAAIGGPRAGDDYEPYYQLSVLGTKAVAEAALQARIPRFVHASSIGVYGVTGKRISPRSFPILETNPSPSNPHAYDRSKIEARELLRKISRRGLSIVCLRLCAPYEPEEFYTGDRSHEFWACISPRNLVQAFHLAATVPLKQKFLVCNVANPSVPDWAVDLQAWIKERWPEVPNYTKGQESLFSLARAKRYLGYNPS